MSIQAVGNYDSLDAIQPVDPTAGDGDLDTNKTLGVLAVFMLLVQSAQIQQDVQGSYGDLTSQLAKNLQNLSELKNGALAAVVKEIQDAKGDQAALAVANAHYTIVSSNMDKRIASVQSDVDSAGTVNQNLSQILTSLLEQMKTLSSLASVGG